MEEKNPIGEQVIDRLVNKDFSNSENQQLDEWLKADPENENDLEKYQKIWDAATDVSTLRKFNAEKAWPQVDSQIGVSRRRIRRLKNMAFVVAGMAASFLVFLSLSFYTDLFSGSGASVSMSTAYGNRSEIVLPDGSCVKLNAGSSLKYHFDKSSKIRQVDFSGEAYFEVAKSNRPFIIQTPEGLNVKVLGTKFNLCTYPDDLTAQTSLLEGRVELSHRGSGNLILEPGQIATFDKKSNQLKYSEGEISHATSWMQNKLYMENMSLQEVCTRMERWYDVRITFGDERLGEKIHYTGVLKEQTVMDVLNAMCQLSNIKYQLNGKNIVISEK